MFKVSISSDRMCPLRLAYFTSMRVENCWSQGTWGADCMLGKASSQAPGGIEPILTSASSTAAVPAVLTALRSLDWSCQGIWWSAAAVTALCPFWSLKDPDVDSVDVIHPSSSTRFLGRTSLFVRCCSRISRGFCRLQRWLCEEGRDDWRKVRRFHVPSTIRVWSC